MNSLRDSLGRLEPVADPGQLGDQIPGFLKAGRPCRLDDAEVVRAAVLPEMFVGIAKPAFVVGWKLGKQGDDVAGVAPSSKDDQRLLLVRGPACVVRESSPE